MRVTWMRRYFHRLLSYDLTVEQKHILLLSLLLLLLQLTSKLNTASLV